MDEQLNHQDGHLQTILQTLFSNEAAEEEFGKVYAYIDKSIAGIE